MTRLLLIITSLVVMLSGCSTTRIPTKYISTLNYSNYTCDQIKLELERLSIHLIDLKKLVKQQDKDNSDNIALSILIFPPLLLLHKDDKQLQQEYSQTKGEFEALSIVSNQKKCD